jgi:hypothetical protein
MSSFSNLKDVSICQWKELGEAYGLDEKAARNRAETVARHFRLVLRDMLTDEVGSEQSADEEIATLLAFL